MMLISPREKQNQRKRTKAGSGKQHWVRTKSHNGFINVDRTLTHSLCSMDFIKTTSCFIVFISGVRGKSCTQISSCLFVKMITENVEYSIFRDPIPKDPCKNSPCRVQRWEEISSVPRVWKYSFMRQKEVWHLLYFPSCPGCQETRDFLFIFCFACVQECSLVRMGVIILYLAPLKNFFADAWGHFAYWIC